MEKQVVKVDGVNAVCIGLKLNTKECFTDKFIEWVHEICLSLLAKAYFERQSPQEMYDELKKIVEKDFGMAGMKIAIDHVADMTSPDNHNKTFEEIKQMVKGCKDA